MNRVLLLFIIIILLFSFTFLNRETFINYKGYDYSDNMNLEEIKNLKKAQEKMTKMFKEFDRICRKHKLKYWCLGGTLIGALRHKGWIPFDGDIDIGMTDIDYKIFKSIIKNELPNHIKFTEPKNKPCSKLSDITAKYTYSKFGNNWDVGNYIMLDIFVFNTKNPTKYYGGSPRRYIEKKTIFPLKEKIFEDIKVYVPNDFKTYLKNTGYENYMQQPNIDKRLPHEGNVEHIK